MEGFFELAVAGKDIRRTNDVLVNDRSEPLDYDYYKQDDGFYMLTFKDIDYDEFIDIAKLLNRNGVTTIGDDDLKENKIIKLADLLKEQSGNENDLNFNRLESAEDIIEMVDEIITDNPDTALDLLSDMVEDYKENQSIDQPDVNLQEIKLRKLIRTVIEQ